MNKLEKRIMDVSEMLSENFLEAALDFRHNTAQTTSLWEAQDVLNPEIEHLQKMLDRMCAKHGLDDALIISATREASTTSYTIGIIAGLYLAGRSDLIPKLARAYEETTAKERFQAYDEDGRFAEAKVLAS